MAQIADIRYDPSFEPIDAAKPTRISISIVLRALPLVYTDECPSAPAPRAEQRYVENPAVLELARQIYASLFDKAVSVGDLRPLIRLAHYRSSHKFGEPMDCPNPEWTGYRIVFDHLVPAGDDDPQVLTLVAKYKDDNTIRVGNISRQDFRVNVNEAVKKWDGKLGETSADGLTTVWP